jgi:hypothetical protein
MFMKTTVHGIPKYVLWPPFGDAPVCSRKGVPMGREDVGRWTCSNFAMNVHLETLKYGYENGCQWKFSDATYANAARDGHFDIFKYAHQIGCPWSRWTCYCVAQHGCLEMFQCARNPWNAATCSTAATPGKLEILRYAHENGCPWDYNTCSRAALYGHWEALQYAHENGTLLQKQDIWKFGSMPMKWLPIGYMDMRHCCKSRTSGSLEVGP